MSEKRTVLIAIGIALILIGLVMVPIGIWRVRDGAAWNQVGDKLDQEIQAEIDKGRLMTQQQEKARRFANNLREFGEKSLVVQAWVLSLLPLITGVILLIVGSRIRRVQKRYG